MSEPDTRNPPEPITAEPTPEQILERLGQASRRGRLPGYTGSDPRGLFSLEAPGNPFDKRLVAKVSDDPAGTRLAWSLRLDPRLPGVFIAALVISVWPGLPITDSMLATYFDWYTRLTSGWFQTWMWYIPFVVLPVPWMWATLMKRTHTSTHASALEAVEKVARELGVTPATPPTAEPPDAEPPAPR